MDEYERYFFDLNGYLVVEDVLNKSEIDALNQAIDNNTDLIERNNPEIEVSDTLKGDSVRTDLEGMLMWPKPWSQPFRDLMNHPKISPYLNELLGEKYLLDHLYGILMSSGNQGLKLHGGGGEDTDFAETQFFYRYHNGRMRNGLTVVTFALADELLGDGGFMVVPGSHKSNMPMPNDVTTLDRDMGIVKEVEIKAGSAIIFTEALSHGTMPWKASHQRRAILYKYTSGTLHMAQSYLPEGVEEVLDEFTPEQRAMMNPVPTKS